LEGADVLLPQLEAEILLPTKFDADQRVLILASAGKVALSRQQPQAATDYDKELYKARHLIENFFAKLKLFRCDCHPL